MSGQGTGHAANLARAEQYLARFRFGGVMNHIGGEVVPAASGATSETRSPVAPFGGVKASGIGRDGGDWSFEFYMEQKHIGFATGQHRIPRLGA